MFCDPHYEYNKRQSERFEAERPYREKMEPFLIDDYTFRSEVQVIANESHIWVKYHEIVYVLTYSKPYESPVAGFRDCKYFIFAECEIKFRKRTNESSYWEDLAKLHQEAKEFTDSEYIVLLKHTNLKAKNSNKDYYNLELREQVFENLRRMEDIQPRQEYYNR